MFLRLLGMPPAETVAEVAGLAGPGRIDPTRFAAMQESGAGSTEVVVWWEDKFFPQAKPAKMVCLSSPYL
jgi:hypothetical protein